MGGWCCHSKKTNPEEAFNEFTAQTERDKQCEMVRRRQWWGRVAVMAVEAVLVVGQGHGGSGDSGVDGLSVSVGIVGQRHDGSGCSGDSGASRGL